MKIRKVILENVKSYRREEITFHDGVNVIAGRNGAGKSTLIEAIGLALFGYMNKDYSYQDFISYGATSGGITVEFEVDDCCYRIERSFGIRGTRGWVISDLQTGEVIETHSVEDVNYTLAQILGMTEEISLAELFERIIGVSQGTFTEPFLRTSGGRKEYFERIFMLDSYKTAYHKSSDTAALIRGQVDDLEKELIRLRTRVEEYPLLKRQAKEEEARLAQRKTLWDAQTAALQTAKTELQAARALRERIRELGNTRIQLGEQQKQLEERIRATAEEIQISREARVLVEAHAETHARYRQWKEEILRLEQQLEAHERLAGEKQKHETDLAIAQENWKGRSDNLISTRTALLEEDEGKSCEIEEYLIPLKGIDRELKTAGEELERTEWADAGIGVILQGYQSCEMMILQLKNCLRERENLREEADELGNRLQSLPELEARLVNLPACEREWEDVNRRISGLETRIATEMENMDRVGDGLCPLLKTECITIEGRNLREHFQKCVTELEEARKGEMERKVHTAAVLQSLRQDAQQCATLHTLAATRHDRLQKIGSVEERAKDLIGRMDGALLEIYTRLVELKRSGFLPGAGELSYKNGLPLEPVREEKRFTTELDIVQNNLAVCQSEIKARKLKSLAKKDELTARKAEFNGKMSQIQGRRNEIRQKLDELTASEAGLAGERAQWGIVQEKIRTLDAALQSFGDLKGAWKRAKEELAEREEGNQVYLKNEARAQELPALEERARSLETVLTETAAQIEETAAQLSEEESRLKDSGIEELETRANELHQLTAETRTLIQEGERRLEELTDRLREMEQVRQQIKGKEREESGWKKALDLMNFIRNVYNSSAEEIAQVFLQYISHDATQIYRQLSGENVQLIWEKDYQIKLKDKHRTRIFKQLSGGEQMSAAFAVRLALLRKFSTVRLGFFDEPTTHLDEYRRLNIAQAIAGIREKSDDYFEQIFVISHDDTFTTLTENLIRLEKSDEGSYLATTE